jgi:hypothetical protein
MENTVLDRFQRTPFTELRGLLHVLHEPSTYEITCREPPMRQAHRLWRIASSAGSPDKSNAARETSAFNRELISQQSCVSDT